MMEKLAVVAYFNSLLKHVTRRTEESNESLSPDHESLTRNPKRNRHTHVSPVLPNPV
jgi:hypothetical protein